MGAVGRVCSEWWREDEVLGSIPTALDRHATHSLAAGGLANVGGQALVAALIESESAAAVSVSAPPHG